MLALGRGVWLSGKAACAGVSVVQRPSLTYVSLAFLYNLCMAWLSPYPHLAWLARKIWAKLKKVLLQNSMSHVLLLKT